ncbi:MAG: 6-carboxytetrahydropterin synthase QueD [Candidatus Atribacteria bacterium]|nr:6-carboxytetrahydropterin synthase QueD [Candidatus Atribacteria bacterium]
MFLTRIFKFSAAHFLPDVGGKCEKLHGHTYKLEVTVEGEPGEDGLVMNFADLKKIVEEKVLEGLDHAHLNEVMENPSAEKIAIWVWERLKGEMSGGVRLYEVKVWESENAGVGYRGVGN